MAALRVEPAAYPAAQRGLVVDEHFGVSVPDPYRWLEEPDAEETKAFVAAQNVLTQSVLSECDARDAFRSRFRRMYDFERHGVPSREGARYVFSHNSGLQAQNVLYSRASLDEPPVVLLDPNTLSDDGTVSLSTTSFTHDGSLMAYGLSKSGSDWITGHVLRVDAASGATTPLPDVVEHAKFTSFSWLRDGSGFFYCRYKEAGVDDKGTEVTANVDHQVWFHRLGTGQADDVFVLAMPEGPSYILGATVSECGRFLWVTASEGCDPRNKLWYVDLSAGAPIGADMPVTKLVDDFCAGWYPIVAEGSVVTLQTNLDAPKYKLVRVDVSAAPTSPRDWQTVLPEAASVMEWASCAAGDALLVCYLADAQHRLQLHSLATGALRCPVAIPIGSVRGVSGRREDTEMFVGHTSFLDPGAVYKLETAGEGPVSPPSLVVRSTVADFDPEQYTCEQVFVPSKDGTRVPMFIVTAKNFTKDGSAPALLYGYGGFNISLTPSFSTSKMCFVRSFNAVYAVANLRGGGEYGEEWHKAGSLERKQNCFDDFAACAQFLIDEGYTQPARLAIEGGSNGGLLVAASVNQRPELFGAAVAHVGVLDMLRFHLFTIGHAWKTDYGGADESEEQFRTLFAYSPIHNVRPRADGGQYPAMMLLTGDHDDRVVPLHSLKHAATLQHTLSASSQTNPLIIRVDVKSGHGAGKPTVKIIDEMADVYGYIAKSLSAAWVE